ncbi:MAG: haloacid dehalogenase-like hydrolase [Bryobacteraceae bacterium]|nr:haloacid dehalogenase-like hydrolase [Bryobacteraceae bacterium]
MPLVLFDIDGTLLRKQGIHHRQALIEAAQRAFAVPVSMEGVPVAGMLDHTILMEMLGRAGIPQARIRAAMPAMQADAERWYLRNAPASLRSKVCPGARMLLYRLHRRGVATGLVTGNFSRIGWRKMDIAGLRGYLRFGAFAEMARDRAGLVGIAVREARRKGWIDRCSPVVLIGDHVNDILAAKANGVRAVAVATGVLGAGELQAHQPHLVVDTMRELSVDRLLA